MREGTESVVSGEVTPDRGGVRDLGTSETWSDVLLGIETVRRSLGYEVHRLGDGVTRFGVELGPW